MRISSGLWLMCLSILVPSVCWALYPATQSVDPGQKDGPEVTATTQPEEMTRQAIALFEKCQAKIDPDRYVDSPDGGDLAWGESYVLMAYVAMYEGTGRQEYLDVALGHIDTVLDNRSDRLGIRDEVRDRLMPAWVTGRYSDDRATAWAVHAGMITYPMARLAVVLQRDPDLAARYRSQIDRILTDVDETLRGFEPDYRDGPGYGQFAEGYYISPALKRDMPYNMQNALGRTFVCMYLATGEEFYRDRARRLARYFASRLRATGPRYLWDYWVHRPRFEDISHAGTDVDFVIQAHRAKVFFSGQEVARFAETFKSLREDGEYPLRVDGSGGQDLNFSIQIGRWGRLGYVDPAICQELLRFYQANWEYNVSPSLLAAAIIVETLNCPLPQEPVTAPEDE